MAVRLTDVPSKILDTRKKAFCEEGAIPTYGPADTLEHLPYEQSKLNETSKLHLLRERGELPIDPATALPIRDVLEEKPVRVMFKTSVPINGKTAFTALHKLSKPVSCLRLSIATSLNVAAIPTTVTLHRADTLQQIDESLTFLEQGFRFVPLLHLRGFGREYFLTTAGSLSKMAIEWAPHHTVTELVKEVWRRLHPYDLRLSRLSIHMVPLGMNESKVFRLDSSRSFLYDESSALDPETAIMTISGGGSTLSPSDPVCAGFFRTKGGQRLMFDLASGPAVVCGSTTIAQIGEIVLNLEKEKRLDQILLDPTDELLDLLYSEAPFDDSDEEIAPGGQRKVYFHGNLPHPTFSFNPPEAARGPKFISIDEDFCIGHLSDCGIFPGSEVLVEFFNPHTQQWSGEVSQELENSAGKDAAASTDLLTIRCDRGQVLRIPASSSTTVSAVLRRIFCACGMLPMFTVLRTEAGKLLCEWETLASAALLPHATLFATHRPRVWLGESLPEISKSLEFGLPEPPM